LPLCFLVYVWKLFCHYNRERWWYRWYGQPTRCINNSLLIIPINSTCFGRWFRSSSGALDSVYSLWYNASTMLPVGSLYAEFLRIQATGRQHRGCIIPQTVNIV
jgi:hypothetical protein